MDEGGAGGAGGDSFVWLGETYRIGETVTLKPPDEQTLPYVGRIEAFENASDGFKVRVSWFYRPEEAAGGRKAFHSMRELFESDHLDWVGAASITGRCRVSDLRAFQSLPAPSDTDFFVRFTYRAAGRRFTPARVPVFCKCEMPYNPDHVMIECVACADWYHPECIGMARVDAGVHSRGFTCPICVEYMAARAEALARNAAREAAAAAGPSAAGGAGGDGGERNVRLKSEHGGDGGS